MWRYRSKSSSNDHNLNNHNHKNKTDSKIRTASSNPDFNHQSFKDIDNLFPHGDNRVSNFSKAQKESNSFSQNCSATATPKSVANDVKKPSIFHRVHLANRFTRAFSARPEPDPRASSQLNESAGVEQSENQGKFGKPEKLEKLEKIESPITIPGADKRVVVYMTSLRAVRPTFEACRTVRSILQGFRVPIEERDLLMDSSFSGEIHKIMAQIGQGGCDEKKVTLPKVFIGGRYIGGVEEVVELHEIGKLKKFVSGLPAATPGVCEVCGGFRFILCEECNGSHKCHLDDGGFRACTVCNENGLIRCSSCLSS